MNKAKLLRAFDRHGIGAVYGYGPDGFVGRWEIRRESDIDRLPASLAYEWVH
jgi:hypothetical protein